MFRWVQAFSVHMLIAACWVYGAALAASVSVGFGACQGGRVPELVFHKTCPGACKIPAWVHVGLNTGRSSSNVEV